MGWTGRRLETLPGQGWGRAGESSLCHRCCVWRSLRVGSDGLPGREQEITSSRRKVVNQGQKPEAFIILYALKKLE